MADSSPIYRGQIDDRVYEGDAVDVSFSGRRCIHAARCVSHLAAVFDVDQRPWIQPDRASAEAIAEVVVQCPSGALHYSRKDGGEAEAIPAENVITVTADSYLRLRGDLRLDAAGVELAGETRATLCRCGASSKKPFCDNSHREIGFEAEAATTGKTFNEPPAGGPLQITVHANGPIEVAGNFRIENEHGETIFHGEQKTTWLCRCGASASKPFCDQSHKRINFEAE